MPPYEIPKGICTNLARIFLALFLLTFPFEIRTLIYDTDYLLTGNFNYFTSFFLYFSDISLVSAFFFRALAVYRREADAVPMKGGLPYFVVLIIFGALLFVPVYYSEIPVLNFFLALRFFELMMLVYLLTQRIWSFRKLVDFFLLGMGMQAVIAIGQYVFQHSLGLRFLGEPSIAPDIPGVAKMDLDGTKMIRPYGTFSHPNVLAGGLIAALFLCWYRFRKHFVPALLLLLLFGGALLLTFSRAAYLALAGGFLIYASLSYVKIKWRYVLLAVSAFVFVVVLFNLQGTIFSRVIFSSGDTAVSERLQYLGVSKDILTHYPFGLGLGHFTMNMQDFVPEKMQPWDMQPVHNVFLLVANEAGVVASLFFLFLFVYAFFLLLTIPASARQLKKRTPFPVALTGILSSFAIISLFDHYFFTTYQGQVILYFSFGLVVHLLNKERLPRKKS